MSEENTQLKSEKIHVVVGFCTALIGVVLFLIAASAGNYVANGSVLATISVSLICIGPLIWFVGARVLNRY